MSYIFDIGDTTVWSPALRVGELYAGMAESLAAWASMPSGLSSMASDYYVIDPRAFRAFVEALLQSPSSRHRIFGELTRGFVAISLVMLNRGSVPLPDLGEDAEDVTALVDAIAASMPV